MKYLLVLQCPSSSLIKDYDAMIEAENALIARLSVAHKVDGHDAGSGEVNVFILTDDPARAFDEIRAILDSPALWLDARVAYREAAGSQFTVLWPKGLNEFNVT
jgi:hypothetical protein